MHDPNDQAPDRDRSINRRGFLGTGAARSPSHRLSVTRRSGRPADIQGDPAGTCCPSALSAAPASR